MKRTHLLPGLLGLMAVFVAALFVLGAWGGSATVRVADAETVALRTPQRPDQAHRTVGTEVLRLRAAAAAKRRQRREAFADLPGGVSIETLESIASCESGGDPTVVSAGGTYRGKYQFSYGTWESVGGHGDPAAAPEAEQDFRAALLYSRSGSSPWPVCG
jgi:Transglycosylase-like domain